MNRNSSEAIIPTDDQRRPHGGHEVDLHLSTTIPQWLPPAVVVLDAVTAVMCQTTIVLNVVYLLLFHGGTR